MALRWCPRPHHTGIIASIKLSLLPVLRRRCCQVGPQRSGQYSAGVCRRCAGVLPALRWRHCQHRAAVIVAGVTPALSSLARGRLCPHRAPLVVAFALPPSLPFVVSLPYPVSSMPILRFLSPDALAAMHVPFAPTLLLERLTAAAAILVTTIPQATAGCAVWSLPLITPALPPASQTGVCPSEWGHTMAVVVVGVGHLLAGQRLPWARNQLARGRCCLGGPARTPGHCPRPHDVAIGHLLDGGCLPWVHDMLSGGRCCLGGPDQTLGYCLRPLDGRAAMAIACLCGFDPATGVTSSMLMLPLLFASSARAEGTGARSCCRRCCCPG